MCGCMTGGKCICGPSEEASSSFRPAANSCCSSGQSTSITQDLPVQPPQLPSMPPLGYPFQYDYSLPSTPSLDSGSLSFPSDQSSFSPYLARPPIDLSQIQLASTPLLPHQSTPLLDCSFLAPVDQSFNPVLPSITNMPVFPQYVEKPSPLAANMTFNDWVFGDILIPQDLLPPSPVDIPVMATYNTEGQQTSSDCRSCGSGCKCGDTCGCAHVQAVHKTLNMVSFCSAL